VGPVSTPQKVLVLPFAPVSSGVFLICMLSGIISRKIAVHQKSWKLSVITFYSMIFMHFTRKVDGS
jgi:hypothetical protein